MNSNCIVVLFRIRRYTLVAVFIIAALLPWTNIQAQKYGDFPYFQSFTHGNPIPEVSFPSAGKYTSNSAVVNSEGLQLTPFPASTDKFGGIFINNRKFSSSMGIKVEFEYMMHGGTGADGISVFFFNADVKDDELNIGPSGAALGYTYRRTGLKYKNMRQPGLTKAYLGIGIDAFGYFKSIRWEGEERIGGIDWYATGKSHITLRGAVGKPFYKRDGRTILPGLGQGYTGYPVLISQSTLDKNDSYILGSDGNSIKPIPGSTYPGNFNLRSGSTFTNDDNPAYRKIFIELFPKPASNPGMYVTVKIKHGKEITTVIDNYEYNQSFLYKESAYPEDQQGDDKDGQQRPFYSSAVTLDATIPQFLRIGFAASTGAYTDTHVIKNLSISLPSAAEAYDDEVETGQGTRAVIFPLLNDIAYNGIVKKDQVGSAGYIDPQTFRFIDEAGQPSPTPYFITTTQGSWTYTYDAAQDKGKVTFVPNKDFIGEATVRYDIKGGRGDDADLYKDEAYRSVPANIVVNVISGKPVKVNKMITPVLK